MHLSKDAVWVFPAKAVLIFLFILMGIGTVGGCAVGFAFGYRLGEAETQAGYEHIMTDMTKECSDNSYTQLLGMMDSLSLRVCAQWQAKVQPMPELGEPKETP